MRNVIFALFLGVVFLGEVSATPPHSVGWGRVDQKTVITDGSGNTVSCTVRVVAPGDSGEYTSVAVSYSGSLANTCRFTSVATCPRSELTGGNTTTWTCDEGTAGACISYAGSSSGFGFVGSSFSLSTACRLPESSFTAQGLVVSIFEENAMPAPCSPLATYNRGKLLTGPNNRHVFFAYPDGLPVDHLDTPVCAEVHGVAMHHCASTEVPLLMATSIRVLPEAECSCEGNPSFC